MAINIETHNWSTHRESETREGLELNRIPISNSYFQIFSDHCRRGGGKSIRARGNRVFQTSDQYSCEVTASVTELKPEKFPAPTVLYGFCHRDMNKHLFAPDKALITDTISCALFQCTQGLCFIYWKLFM